MIEGGAIALVAAFVGWIAGRRARRQPDEPVTPPPFCSCSHAFSAHDKKTGECLAEVKREHYLTGGSRNGYEYVDCACTHYDGPVPIESFTPRGFTLPES